MPARAAAPTPRAPGPVSRPTRRTNPARYAVGMFGTSIPINMFNAYMAYFYVNQRGMDGRVYAAIMVLYTVIDALDNIVYAWLSDRTRTRWGRRKPWLLASAPLLACSLILFFSVPDRLTGTTLVVWFGIFAILTQTLDSMVNANYGPLLPESFPTERVRSVANSLRQGFQLLAMALSIALTPKITELIGFRMTAIIFGVLAVVVITFMATGVHEDPTVQHQRQPPLFSSLRAIAFTKEFWPIALASGAYSAGMGLTVAAVPFYVTYALHRNQGDGTYLLVAVLATAVLALPMWTMLVRRLGAPPIWRTALVLLAVALLALYPLGTLGPVIGVGVAVGAGYAGVLATVDLIVARMLDLDTVRHGTRREGVFLSAVGLLDQLSGFAQSIGFTAVAVLYGFHSGTAPGPTPDRAARFLLSVLPCTFIAIAAALSFLVRLGTAPGDEIASVTSRAEPSEPSEH